MYHTKTGPVIVCLGITIITSIIISLFFFFSFFFFFFFCLILFSFGQLPLFQIRYSFQLVTLLRVHVKCGPFQSIHRSNSYWEGPVSTAARGNFELMDQVPLN